MVWTDTEIHDHVVQWIGDNRLSVAQAQAKLKLTKATYYRRINSGGWTYNECQIMKKLGILPAQNKKES